MNKPKSTSSMQISRFLLSFICLALSANCIPAFAFTPLTIQPTIHWIGTADGAWETAANWMDSNKVARVPGVTDDVLIDNGAATNTITISTGQKVHSLLAKESLAISGLGSLTIGAASELDAGFTLDGAVAINGPLTLVGVSQWNSGYIFGAANIENAGTMTLSGSNTKFLLCTLNNTGTIAHQGGALQLDSGTVGGLGTLNNSGLYNMQGDVEFARQLAATGSISNSGTWRKSAGPGSGTSRVPFYNNSGTIDIQSGTFTLLGGTHSGGTFSASASAMLVFSGVHAFTGTYTGSGAGIVQLAGDHFTVGASLATFNFPGNMLRWLSGDINGGTAGLTNAGTMTVIPGGTNTNLLGTINNAGKFIESGVVALDISGSAVFTNLVGAVFDFQGDGGMFEGRADATPYLFINHGTVRKSVGGYSNIQVRGFNTGGGIIEVLSGTLGIGAGSNDGGTFKVVAGATLDLTDGLNHGTNGFNVKYKGLYTGSGQGTVLLAGNTLTVDPAGATFNFPAGLFQWTGGAIYGTTALTNVGTMTLSGTNTKLLLGVLNNTGTIAHQSGALELTFSSQFFSAAGTLNNIGLYDLQGDVAIQRNWLMPAVVNNSGILRKSAGTGTATGFALPLNNTGTVEIRSGTFTFASSSVVPQISGTILTGGTWNVFANSTLVLPGSITTNQANITLNGLGAAFTSIAGLTSNSGSLSVLGGQTFTTTSSFANTGNLVVGAGSALHVTGNYSQTAAASLTVRIDGRPINGRFGQLVSSGVASLDGALNVLLANGFGTTAGDIYPVTTYASKTGAFATITGLTAGAIPLFRADALTTNLTLTTLASEVNLAASVGKIVTDPTKPGQNVSVSYSVNNLGSIAATGAWDDQVYLSATPFIDASAVLLGTVHHTGGVAALGSYTGTLTAPLPALLPNGYYVIVVADSNKSVPDVNRSNNTSASSGTLPVTIPILSLGAPLTDTIANRQDAFYHLVLPPGADVTLSAQYALTPEAELYVRYGALPDRTNFDLSTLGNLGNAGPVVTLSNTLGGDYYILLHGLSAAGQGQSVTLKATNAQFELLSFSPQISLNLPNEKIDLKGTKFSPATTVSLIAPDGTVYASSSISFANSGQITAIFDLSAVPLGGSYTVRATDNGQVSSASTLFQVSDVNITNFATPIFMLPGRVRVGAPIPMSVKISGGPNVFTPVPFVQVDATNVASGEEKQTFVDPQLPKYIAPDDSLSFGFIYHPNPKAEGVVSGFDLSMISLGQSIDWDARKEKLRPTGAAPDAWDAVWANLRLRLGSIAGDFYALLKKDSLALAAVGVSTSSVNRLFSFELSKANDQLPMPHLAAAVDVAYPAPGMPLIFERTLLSSSITGRYRLGRMGRGWIDNFDISAVTDLKRGLVTISNGRNMRLFNINSDGTYRGFLGESATLTQSGGAYQLQEKSGAITGFRADGSLSFVQDTRNNRLTAGYDGTKLTSITHSNGSKLALTYNGQSRISQVTDPAGRTTTYTYDSTGEQLLSVTTLGGTFTYSYTPERSGPHAFALASIGTPSGVHRFFEHDEQGRLKRVQADGGAQSLSYSYGETTIRATDAAGHSASIAYDPEGLIINTADALGHTQRAWYDQFNRLMAVATQGGGVMSSTYDTQGNRVSATDPLGATVSYAYEPTHNRLSAWTDSVGNSMTFAHDAPGNLTLSAYADGSSNQYSYDVNGNLIRSVDRNGYPTTYGYDSRGLLTSRQLAGGSLATYGYDAHANLTSVVDAIGTTTLQYDAADRVTRVSYPNGRSLSYAYDAGGRRTQRVDQTGFTVNYSYDAVGHLASLTDGNGKRIVQYTYDTVGQLARRDNGNGTYTTYDYDANGNVLHIVNFASATTVNSSFGYTYDVLGRRSSVTTPSGTTKYGYDGDSRLTSVLLPTGRKLTYVYDAAGNRLGATDNGAATAYSINSLNQYTVVGDTNQFFDQGGNLTSTIGPAGNASYTYDLLNRLVSVTNAAGTWSYEYDALGHRFAVTHLGQRTEYLVDPVGLGDVAAEFDGSGNLLAHYAQGLGVASRIDAANGASYYDFDAIGSTVGLTGSNGAYVNRYDYLPFGEKTAVTETVANPFTYVGALGVQDDGDGRMFMRARYYDSLQGRFVQPDPIGLAGGLNFYSYAGNNPVTRVDPSGMLSTNYGFTYGHLGAIQGGVIVNDDGKAFPYFGAGVGAGGGFSITESTASTHDNELSVTINGGASRASGGISYGFGSGWSLSGGLGGLKAGIFAGLNLTFGQIDRVVPVVPEQTDDCDYVNLSPVDCQGYSGGMSTEDPWGGMSIGAPLLSSPDLPNGVNAGHLDVEQVTPSDPNYISGPAGYGPGGFIVGDASIPYLIGYENKPAATAPAQQVIITETLDPNLDLSTFRLGDFGFGDVTLHVPDNRQTYTTRIDASTSQGFYIDVNASLDTASRVVTWSITAIDPHTLAPPADPGIGFLPPNKKPPEGDGWVTYFVQPKSGLVTGTAVSAQASVVFDTNAAMATNLYMNRLDTTGPSSHVTALPTTESSASFTVTWSAIDSAGPGIASYDVLVSMDGGAFAPFVVATAATSAVFQGTAGHTYGFYSQSIDNLGLREAPKSMAETTTNVSVGTNEAPEPPAKSHRSGWGCTLSDSAAQGMIDPTLPFLVVFAGYYWARRRNVRVA